MGPKTKSQRHVNARRSLDLTLAIREGIHPQILFQWNLAILQGLNPVLVEDASKPLGWYIKHDEGQPTPTLDQKQRAAKELEDRGYGQAVQMIALQGELRTASLDAGQQLPSGQLTPGGIWAIEQAIRGALGAGSPAPTTTSDHDDAIDAECVDASASDDDDQDLEQPAPATASDHDDE